MKAEEVFEQIMSTHSDILMLQETVNKIDDWYRSRYSDDAAILPQEMASLDDILTDAGYHITLHMTHHNNMNR